MSLIVTNQKEHIVEEGGYGGGKCRRSRTGVTVVARVTKREIGISFNLQFRG